MSTLCRHSEGLPDNSNSIMDQSASRLLSLPRELRDMIWVMTYTDDTVQLDRTEAQSTAPGLLVACKQSYSEAINLYYKHSTFFFRSGKKCSQWLGRISRSHIHTVTRLRFDTATTHMCLFGTPCSAEDARVALAVFHMDLIDHGIKIGERVVKASVEGDDGFLDWSIEFPLDSGDATCVAIVSAPSRF